jgi:hypothetical protein
MGIRSSICTKLFLIVAACGHPPVAETPSAAAVSTPPAELAIPSLAEHRSDPRFHADRIYVYGRSENHIAFVTEPADDVCGCYQPTIVLQDLRHGNVVWKDSYDSEKAPVTEKWKTLDELWRARGGEWERRLRETGIERGPAPPLAQIPTGGTSVPRFELHTEKADDQLTSYRIELVTPRGVDEIAKVLGATDLSHVEVMGVVPQIGDGAAAVLVLETRNGFEKMALHRVRVVGAEVRVEPN